MLAVSSMSSSGDDNVANGEHRFDDVANRELDFILGDDNLANSHPPSHFVTSAALLNSDVLCRGSSVTRSVNTCSVAVAVSHLPLRSPFSVVRNDCGRASTCTDVEPANCSP